MKAWQAGALAGSVGYFGLMLVSRLVTPLIPGINRHYKALSPGDRIEWDTRTPSCVQALMAVVGCYHCALFSHDHQNNRVGYYDDRLVVPYGITGLGPEFYMAVFVGYLAADLVPLLIYRDQMEMHQLMIAHHLFAGLCWTVAIGWQTMQWYACFLMLAELSTPIANLRWWLAKSNISPSSVTYLIVCSWLFVTFFMARIMCLPFVLYMFVRYDAAKVEVQFHWMATTLWSTAFVVHSCLQSYWFSLMIKAVLAKLMGQANTEAEGLHGIEERGKTREPGLDSENAKAKRTAASSTDRCNAMD